jgi:methionyl-tRNA formyltransferase
VRVLFVGAVAFSARCLRETLEAGGNVVGVLTLPPELAGQHADYQNLRPIAAQYGVPVHHIRRINDPEVIELISWFAADVLFVFGWSQIVSPAVRALAPLGCIGTHPTLLPRNRGRHPIVWALVQGLERTGLTFFYLDDGIDSGDILWQAPCDISPEDDAASLYAKIENLAARGIREFLPRLQQGTAERIAQDHSQATYWRKRTERDGEIRWSDRSITIHNLVRGLARPYVGAHTALGGVPFRVWRSHPVATPSVLATSRSRPGLVLSVDDDAVSVLTGDGVLAMLDYDDGVRGRLAVGVMLGCP